jgi:hypothetical protein
MLKDSDRGADRGARTGRGAKVSPTKLAFLQHRSQVLCGVRKVVPGLAQRFLPQASLSRLRCSARRLIMDSHHGFDLNRNLKWQRAHTDSGTRMPAAFAQHGDK